MTTSEWVSLGLSIATIFISLVALGISIWQIRQQNNLSLLDKRIQLLEVARSLTEPLKYHAAIFAGDIENKDNKPLYTIDFSFWTLTNSLFLEAISDTVDHPLESEYQNKFLLKIEDLRKQSDLFEMSFPLSIGKDFSDLCNLYSQALLAAYKYKVCLNSLRKDGTPIENNELEMRKRTAYKSVLSDLLAKSRLIEEKKLYEALKKKSRVCIAKGKDSGVNTYL